MHFQKIKNTTVFQFVEMTEWQHCGAGTVCFRCFSYCVSVSCGQWGNLYHIRTSPHWLATISLLYRQSDTSVWIWCACCCCRTNDFLKHCWVSVPDCSAYCSRPEGVHVIVHVSRALIPASYYTTSVCLTIICNLCLSSLCSFLAWPQCFEASKLLPLPW